MDGCSVHRGLASLVLPIYTPMSFLESCGEKVLPCMEWGVEDLLKRSGKALLIFLAGLVLLRSSV